ncbi:hypothetical protein J6590_042074 [Homalodisca vitripennis]|nr:hypothetical protein J6590_042074 [Homalodisca vitripennis]
MKPYLRAANNCCPGQLSTILPRRGAETGGNEFVGVHNTPPSSLLPQEHLCNIRCPGLGGDVHLATNVTNPVWVGYKLQRKLLKLEQSVLVVQSRSTCVWTAFSKNIDV